MILFEEFSAYIMARTERRLFVESGEHLSSDDVDLLREIFSINKSESERCIEGGVIYTVEARCSEEGCDNCDTVEWSKARLIRHISYPGKTGEKHLCLFCQEDKRRKDAAEWGVYKRSLVKDTECFIDDFLDPEGEWSKCCPAAAQWAAIKYAIFLLEDLIRRHIVSELTYKEFLKTPYWKAIASRKRWEANFKCQMCNSSEPLSVHHRTYDNHGLEHRHLRDLIALCDNCHKIHHFEGYSREAGGASETE